MAQTPDISNLSMVLAFLMALIPMVVGIYLKLNIAKKTIIALVRMGIQLGLIGIFLVYLFKMDNPLLNISWLLVMISFAAFSVISNSGLSMKTMTLPILASVLLPTTVILIYYNLVVIRLENIFAARFFIVIGGMILGNCLRSNIVSLSTFYNNIRANENRYLARIGLGGTVAEASLPFMREAVNTTIAPSLATMATMGIVSIPGMMTGQILGGSSPTVAVKYQITIMLAILSTAVLSSLLAILFSIPVAFSKTGMLKKDIFNKALGSDLFQGKKKGKGRP